jgi:hypothetical protein
MNHQAVEGGSQPLAEEVEDQHLEGGGVNTLDLLTSSNPDMVVDV